MRKLTKFASKEADFVQKFEIGPVDDPDSVSISASDPYDMTVNIDYIEYSIDGEHVNVRIPTDQLKMFTNDTAILTILAVQNRILTNPVNCEIQFKR